MKDDRFFEGGAEPPKIIQNLKIGDVPHFAPFHNKTGPIKTVDVILTQTK